MIFLIRKYIKKWLLERDKIWRSHDQNIFLRSNKLLNERSLLDFLEILQNDHSYHTNNRINITRFCIFFEETGNQYLNKKLRNASVNLVVSLDTLTGFAALNFFVFPRKQQSQNLRLCMQPDCNIDRELMSGDKEAMVHYSELTKKLDDYIESTRCNLMKYRNTVRNILSV